MDAPAPRWLDRLAGAIDIFLPRAREPADHGILGALGNLVHGCEIAVGGDREAGLDDVDAHLVEHLGDFELLLMSHGGAGALLAVAQGGVENDDPVRFGLGFGSHGNVLLVAWRRGGLGCWALGPWRSWVSA